MQLSEFSEEVTPMRVELLPGGRIYLAAYFFPDPNTLIARVVRLLPNGKPDTAFAGGSGVTIQPGAGEGSPWVSTLRFVLPNHHSWLREGQGKVLFCLL